MVNTRHAERLEQERLAVLRLLPGADDFDSDSELSDPPDTPDTPDLTPRMFAELPKFDGNDAKAKSFLNDFEIAMLDRNIIDDDVKKARYFVRCMTPDTRSEQWVEQCDQATKGSFEALETSFKATFCDKNASDIVQMAALQQMMKTRLRDQDVGKTDAMGVPMHVKYCEEMARLGRSVPNTTADSTKVATILTNVGGGLAKVIRDVGQNDTFEHCLKAIKELTDWQIKEIQHWAIVEQWSSRPPKTALPISPALSVEALPASRSNSFSNPTQRTPRNEAGGSNDRDNRYVAITPAHQAKIDEWESRWGVGSEVTADCGFPLTPGTDPTGSRECYKCGTKKPSVYLARDCPNLWVNQREQNYRYKVSERRRIPGNQQYQARQSQYQNFGAGYRGSGANQEPLGQPVPVHAITIDDDSEEEDGLGWMDLQGAGNARGLGF
ncbi:hypothetical protein HD553DRAFT_345130 [Filobasidium floriforme]|uniref:uncharacterized protein n=1 Tax=Filobasidium floriforme TaxID=5210 RepID=UPI001E8D451E|nr:uncharacterized protein HD553DRAFT_345130 [Filobasidium floriforme]KAH8080212.1 hypothetical protein HD553DRAFT_345130 [Filobasidium floriforme]